MKIFLASAEPDDVTWAVESGLADGILTSPQLLADAGAYEDPRGLIQDLCRTVPGPVLVSVESVGSDEMYRDGRELARLGDQVTVEVPLVEDGIAAVRRLVADGVRVAAGLVYSPVQALLATKAGVSMVICRLQHLDAAGHHAMQVIEEMRQLLDVSRAECDLLAVHATSSAELTRAALAGADGVAVMPECLRSLLVHPLTDRGVDRFLSVLGRLPTGRLGS
ncbi:MAG TPA: transaldolase family protein [Gemmatimonadales bacterium]